MFRRGLVLAVLLALTLTFGLQAQDKVVVTFWHAMSGGLGDTVDALVAQFNEQNPDVEVQAVFQGRYGDLFQKELASVAAGEPPTIAQMFENWTPQFLQPALDESALAPIGTLIDTAVFDDMPQIFVKANTYTVGGAPVITTVPFNKSATVLYYNKDVVSNPPQTWDALLQVASSLNKDTDGDGQDDVFGFGMRPGSSGISEIYLTFVRMAGGSIISPDCKSVDLNSDAAVTALTFLKNLASQSLVTGDFLDGVFADNKIFMYYDSSAGIGFATRAVGDKFNWSTSGGLSGPVSTSSVIQGTNLGIFKMGHSQAEIDAAARFIQFLIDVPQTVFWAEQTGYLPVRKSAIDSSGFQEFLGNNDSYRAPTQSLANAFVTPGLAEWGDVRLTIADAVQAVLIGDANIADTLKQLNVDVDDALATVPDGLTCKL